MISAPCNTSRFLRSVRHFQRRPASAWAACRASSAELQPKTLFRSSSPINPLVAVVEFPAGAKEEFGAFEGSRVLVLDETPSAHSVWRPGQVVTGGCWDFYGLLPLFPPESSKGLPIGLYGLGGGSAAILIATLYPDVVVHGWEICPAVMQAAAQHMGLYPFLESGRCVAYVEDAFSETSVPEGGEMFGALGVDCFVGEDPPPCYYDAACWRSVSSRVSPGGCIIINLGDHPNAEIGGLPAASSASLEAIVEAFGRENLQLHLGTSNAMVLVTRGGAKAMDWGSLSARAPPEVRHLAYGWLPYEDLSTR